MKLPLLSLIAKLTPDLQNNSGLFVNDLTH